MKIKASNTISLAGIAAFVVFLNTSAAYAETIGTFNNWDDLQNAITVEAAKAIAGGHPEEMGTFLIEPGSVIEAKDNYLYAGTFTGTLNGGTGDGLANINGLTKPLFNILGAGAQITGLQLTTSTEDKDGIDHAGDGHIGITGQGILANISDGAKIENVRVGGDINYGSFLSAGREVSNLGGLIGEARNTEIKDSTFSGNITSTSDNVGGLVGYLENSTITNSTAKVTDLKGDDYVGGLVGKSFNSTITAGMTVGLIDADSAVGGIVGSATSTVITNSLSKTLIKATGDAIGGLVGELVNYEEKNGEISASVFKGGVIASGVNGQVGGIVGLNYGTITDASSIPLDVGINGRSKVGGVVGSNEGGGVVANSYFDGRVTSNGSAGGIAGNNSGTIENSAASGEIVTKDECVEDLIDIDTTTCAGILVGFNNHGTLRLSVSTTSVAGNEPITNAFAFYLGEEFPKHYLTYLNKDYSPDRWALDICYNSNRPFLNSIKKYFSFDCWSESEYPEKITREFITYTPSLIGEYAKEVAEIKGFEPSLILPSDSPLKFLNKLDQKDLEKIFTSSFDLNTIREISLEKESPIQLEVKGEIGASAQVWVQTPDGSWINLGLITFDEEGNAILPALKFADLGNYKIAFFSNTAGDKDLIDPSKGGAIGSINLQVK